MPRARASCTAPMPTPPLAPCTSTVSPASPWPRWNSAWYAVAYGTFIAAPCAYEHLPGVGLRRGDLFELQDLGTAVRGHADRFHGCRLLPGVCVRSTAATVPADDLAGKAAAEQRHRAAQFYSVHCGLLRPTRGKCRARVSREHTATGVRHLSLRSRALRRP